MGSTGVGDVGVSCSWLTVASSQTSTPIMSDIDICSSFGYYCACFMHQVLDFRANQYHDQYGLGVVTYYVKLSKDIPIFKTTMHLGSVGANCFPCGGVSNFPYQVATICVISFSNVASTYWGKCNTFNCELCFAHPQVELLCHMSWSWVNTCCMTRVKNSGLQDSWFGKYVVSYFLVCKSDLHSSEIVCSSAAAWMCHWLWMPKGVRWIIIGLMAGPPFVFGVTTVPVFWVHLAMMFGSGLQIQHEWTRCSKWVISIMTMVHPMSSACHVAVLLQLLSE